MIQGSSNVDGEPSVVPMDEGKNLQRSATHLFSAASNLYEHTYAHTLTLFLLCFDHSPSIGEKETQMTGIYDLVAVLTHKGRSADSGHYVGWVKQENGWF